MGMFAPYRWALPGRSGTRAAMCRPLLDGQRPARFTACAIAQGSTLAQLPGGVSAEAGSASCRAAQLTPLTNGAAVLRSGYSFRRATPAGSERRLARCYERV